MCNHLSAFGGNLFVAPNPIDFDKVWAEFGRLGETGNFVVLATICSIFGLYFISLVFARREDKKDDMKVSKKLVRHAPLGKKNPFGHWRGALPAPLGLKKRFG